MPKLDQCTLSWRSECQDFSFTSHPPGRAHSRCVEIDIVFSMRLLVRQEHGNLRKIVWVLLSLRGLCPWGDIGTTSRLARYPVWPSSQTTKAVQWMVPWRGVESLPWQVEPHIRKMTGQVWCTCMCLNRLPLCKIVFVLSMQMYWMTVRKMHMELPDGFMESHGIVAWAHGIVSNCCVGSWNCIKNDWFACHVCGSAWKFRKLHTIGSGVCMTFQLWIMLARFIDTWSQSQ